MITVQTEETRIFYLQIHPAAQTKHFIAHSFSKNDKLIRERERERERERAYSSISGLNSIEPKCHK